MAERMFMKADEVAEVLEVSKPYAYKLIRQMNEKLRAKGVHGDCRKSGTQLFL